MIKQYFKQAWQLVKQNKLFSGIYIAGTALGISMVMVMAILNYVRTANIYPETNRDRTLYVKSAKIVPKDTAAGNWSSSGGFSYKAASLFFLPLQTPEVVSLETEPVTKFASLPNDDYLIKVRGRYVDTHYWEVFRFRFVSGKPFTDADFQSGLPVAVISESLARKLFGTADAEGKYMEFGFKEHRVAGVVKDVSYVLSGTYAQVWMPYTSYVAYKEENDWDGLMGNMRNIYLLARSATDFDAIRNEVDENVRRYNAQSTDWKVDLVGQPDTKKVEVNRVWSNVGPDMTKIILRSVLLVALFLLVPAINLSGLNSTRMEQRLSEMGVRKAFGASRKKLLNQLLIENLLLTAMGGLAGWVFSYLLISVSRNWLLDLGKSFADVLPEGASVDFSVSMLFNLKIFFVVLLVCLAMNIVSALIPVYRSLRKNITDSLHIKYS